ncbi:MAG: adenosylcobinamide-GDP ribazoletransferase [Clostridium sp.]|nr:adenosylcobinamide-GDP ribazoletransferase [Clostridium sp.]
MNLLYSIIIAFSMYSALPMPRADWTEERMKRLFCAFPLVGAVEGLLLVLLDRFLTAAGGTVIASPAGILFRTLLYTAFPILYTGGIHMDGYLDVTDARKSFGDRAKKLEIMKDPHVGAFAIIGCGGYLLLYGAGMSLTAGWTGTMGNIGLNRSLTAFACMLPAERALSALAVTFLPKAKKEGLAAAFSRDAKAQAVGVSSAVWIILYGAGALYFGRTAGILLILAAAGTYLWFHRMCLKEFGGVTGDLAGYFLQSCERNMLLVLAFARLFLL